MTTIAILLLLVSLLIASGLSYFQYIYKAKNKSKVNLFLAFLRFLTIFSIFLLLINPIITKNRLDIVKTPLPVVIDNSSSISFLNVNKEVVQLYKKIISNKDIQEKFEVQSYQFSEDFEPSDKFTFKGTQTNIDVVAKNLKNIYKNTNYPTILISDGNQTSGNDYVYSFGTEN